MGILKLVGDDGNAPPPSGSEPLALLLCESPIEMAATSDSHGIISSPAAMLIWFPYLESENHVPCFGAR